MKKIYQTVFGKPHGNCLQACLATLFSLKLEDALDLTKLGWDDWVGQLDAWCVAKRLPRPLLIQDVHNKETGNLITTKVTGACVVSGKSPRGDFLHCTVWVPDDSELGFKMYHDPHPSNDGILSMEDILVFLTRI